MAHGRYVITNGQPWGGGVDKTRRPCLYKILKITYFVGMDLRMTPYSCLATGNQVGIIEFVHNSKTVYNIQRQGNRLAAMQFDSTQLYKWIKDVTMKNVSQKVIQIF